jgi:hypothetical protein
MIGSSARRRRSQARPSSGLRKTRAGVCYVTTAQRRRPGGDLSANQLPIPPASLIQQLVELYLSMILEVIPILTVIDRRLVAGYARHLRSLNWHVERAAVRDPLRLGAGTPCRLDRFCLGDIAAHSADVCAPGAVSQWGPWKEHDKFDITSIIANFDHPLLVLLNISILQAFSNYVSRSDVSFPYGAEHLASLISDIALLRLHMKIIARQG